MWNVFHQFCWLKKIANFNSAKGQENTMLTILWTPVIHVILFPIITFYCVIKTCCITRSDSSEDQIPLIVIELRKPLKHVSHDPVGTLPTKMALATPCVHLTSWACWGSLSPSNKHTHSTTFGSSTHKVWSVYTGETLQVTQSGNTSWPL